MREPHAPDGMSPPDWTAAFAALPPEAPPADALAPVFARIPASTPTRSGQKWWIAAAAVLALAAVIPTWMGRHARVDSDSQMAVQRGNRSPTDLASGHPVPLASSSQSATAAPLQKSTSAAVPVIAAPDRKTLDARVTRHSSVESRGHDEQKQIAKADRPHRKPHRTRKPSPTADPPDSAMEPLYAESARLEALLALARDDRAASATAVALGSDFEARVAGIDAALTQPSLTKQRRLELWRDRVLALRAYASFESTQRALAASGERYDAMLVSID